MNDRTSCVSCGTCWDTCPDLFEEDPADSFSLFREPFRFGSNIATGIPPPEFKACARQAADLCPVQIIRMTES